MLIAAAITVLRLRIKVHFLHFDSIFTTCFMPLILLVFGGSYCLFRETDYLTMKSDVRVQSK